MSFVIRPLRADEAALYRDIRLEALRLHPRRSAPRSNRRRRSRCRSLNSG